MPSKERKAVNRVLNKMFPPADYECMRCENLATHRHHIDRDRTNNARSNIELLCNSCHTREHNATDKNGPEHRQRIAESNRERWKDPEFRARMMANPNLTKGLLNGRPPDAPRDPNGRWTKA